MTVTAAQLTHHINTRTRFGYRITQAEIERATALVNGGYRSTDLPCTPAQAAAQAFTRPPSAMDKLDMAPHWTM